MSYTTTLIGRFNDVDTFLAEITDWGRDIAISAGATQMRINQMVMAGERAGKIATAYEAPTINASMEISAALNANPRIREMMVKVGVQIESRSLMRNIANRGTTDGAYSTYLMMNSDPVDDATLDSNLGDIWSHASAGFNGFQLTQAHAAGSTAFNYGLVTFTDDLDAAAAGSAKAVSSPEVQSHMATYNVSILGRAIMRRLF